MVRCRPFAHAASTCEADLPVKFHAENTPALPANRKGQSGKVLLCPQQDNLATSVAHFCIAVLTRSNRDGEWIFEPNSESCDVACRVVIHKCATLVAGDTWPCGAICITRNINLNAGRLLIRWIAEYFGQVKLFPICIKQPHSRLDFDRELSLSLQIHECCPTNSRGLRDRSKYACQHFSSAGHDNLSTS